MNDIYKTKKQLIEEIEQLRRTVADLEAFTAEDMQEKEVLKYSENVYRNLVDSSLLGVYKATLNGKLIYVNEAFVKICGFNSPEELIKHHIQDVLRSSNGGNNFIDSLKETGQISNCEMEITAKNGQIRNVLLNANLESLVISGMILDITERRKMEEIILSSKLHWESTFNSINDIMTIHDSDYNIIMANKSAQKCLGLPELGIDKEVKCYKYYHGSDRPLENCPSITCKQTNKHAMLIIHEKHLNKYVEIRTIPRLNNNNKFSGVIHIVRDITGLKLKEDTIERQLGHLNALRSIDRAIIGSLDIRITLDIFLSQVITELNIDAASVLLLNPKTQMLEYVINKGFQSNALKYTRLRLGESNAGRAAIERRIVGIPNLKEHIDGFLTSEHFVSENFVTYFGVPLISKGQVKGVLEVFKRYYMEADPEWLEFLEAIADQGAIAIDNATMFNDLQRSNTELILAYDSTIEGWSRAMDLRDKETEGHTQRVTEMTVLIANEMGIKDEDIVQIRRGALLHDMGKMGIPDSILLKPGPLTDEEWVIMKRHPEYAYKMLHKIEYLRPALDIPYYHHEKWDGSGYPQGLKDEQIPLAARIFAVVDVWDALCSDRPYRSAWSKQKVLDYIRSQSGIHFDPEVVEVFLKMSGDINKTGNMKSHIIQKEV